MNIDKDMLLWIAKTIEEFRVSSKKQSEKIMKDNVPVDKRFSWGHVLDRFEYDFDGRTMEVIKYHSWKKDKGTLIVGDADESVIHYHCEELNESTESLEYLVILWIARQSLGQNQHALVRGIAKALDLYKE